MEAEVNGCVHKIVFIFQGDTSLILKTVHWRNYRQGGISPRALMPRMVCSSHVQSKASWPAKLIWSPLKSKSQVSILGSAAHTGLDSLASGRFKWKWKTFHTSLAQNCLFWAVLACWLLLLLPHPSTLPVLPTATVLSFTLWFRGILGILISIWAESPGPIVHLSLAGPNLSPWLGYNSWWGSPLLLFFSFYCGTQLQILIIGNSAYWGLERIIIFLSFSLNIKLNYLSPIISNYIALHKFTLPR